MADVMSSLISFRHTWVKNGILHESDVPSVFSAFDSVEQGAIIGLLDHFLLLHPMPDNKYLVPTLRCTCVLFRRF